jgi:hypothetical protein
MRIRLSDADREKFGCDEWLDYDLAAVTNREMATLQQAFGYDDTMQLLEAFNAQWARDDEDNVTRAAMNYDAWDSLVWIALRQSGALTARTRTEMATELAGLEYQVIRLRVAADAEPEGKDESSTPDKTSPPSSARTRQRSSRRSTGSAGTK